MTNLSRIKRTLLTGLALFFILSLGACGFGCGESSEKTDEPLISCSDGSEYLQPYAQGHEDGSLTVFPTDSHNYTFSSQLTIESVNVRAHSQITFDWSQITVDMLGRPLDPLHGVDMAQVVIFRLSEDELMEKMNDDSLAQSDIDALAIFPTEQSVTSFEFLSLLSPGGAPIEEETLLGYLDPQEYSPAEYTFALMLTEGTVLGKGTKTIILFHPVEGETNQQVNLTDTTAQLDYQVDLQSAQRFLLPPGTIDIVLDWSDSLEKNAFGREFEPTLMTELVVANYSDMSPEQLEGDFLNLEELAQHWYSFEILTGTTASLEDLNDMNSGPIEDLTAPGTWIVALRCGSCANPAPWFLAIIETC